MDAAIQQKCWTVKGNTSQHNTLQQNYSLFRFGSTCMRTILTIFWTQMLSSGTVQDRWGTDECVERHENKFSSDLTVYPTAQSHTQKIFLVILNSTDLHYKRTELYFREVAKWGFKDTECVKMESRVSRDSKGLIGDQHIPNQGLHFNRLVRWAKLCIFLFRILGSFLKHLLWVWKQGWKAAPTL